MKILAKDVSNKSQVVNKVGNYLYTNLIGAYKYDRRPNEFVIWITFLYQLPRPLQKPGLGKEYNDVHEETFYLSIVTYADKLRINFTDEADKMLLGQLIVPISSADDMDKLKHRVFNWMLSRIRKQYPDYNFLI